MCKLSERIKERERVTGPRRLPKGNKAPRRRQPPPPAHLVSLDYTILERRKGPRVAGVGRYPLECVEGNARRPKENRLQLDLLACFLAGVAR